MEEGWRSIWKLGVAAICALVLVGCGGSDGGSAESTTAPPTTACPEGQILGDSGCKPRRTTTEAPPTTAPEPALTAGTVDAIRDCVDMQADAARGIAIGIVTSDAEEVAMSGVCDDASDMIDAEVPVGVNVGRLAAVQLTENALDLSSWELSMSLGGQAGPSRSGEMPADVATAWPAEIDALLQV